MDVHRGQWAVGSRLDGLVGQVVLHAEGDGQGADLLRGHHTAQRHAAQVLQAGHGARAPPEVHTAVTRPSGQNTPPSGEGTAEGVGHGSYGLGRLLLDIPETQ